TPVALFFGCDEQGYAYAIASQVKSVKALAAPLNLALNGRGGGNDGLIQGSVRALREEILKLLPLLTAEYLL
ncbi:MAG: hypothetical protein J6R89_02220, partial [Clostridia bacterium]|nr:hypothetical protein [Clostridia bacterium]